MSSWTVFNPTIKKKPENTPALRSTLLPHRILFPFDKYRFNLCVHITEANRITVILFAKLIYRLVKKSLVGSFKIVIDPNFLYMFCQT